MEKQIEGTRKELERRNDERWNKDGRGITRKEKSNEERRRQGKQGKEGEEKDKHIEVREELRMEMRSKER